VESPAARRSEATAGTPDASLPGAQGAAREAEAAGTRERLLAAAAAVIEEGGFGAASVAAIAVRAGVAAGTLYRHFPSKAELFVEVLRAATRRELAAMSAAVATAEDFAGRFEAAVATWADRALRNRRLAWALVYEPVDALVDAERLAYRREYTASMAKLLRAGVASGAIREQDVDLAAAAVVGVIAETLVGPLSPVGTARGSERRTVAAIVALCRRVIGLPPRE
jgi:AcrR family transcriptional regulator